jgi:hypothetical protein
MGYASSVAILITFCKPTEGGARESSAHRYSGAGRRERRRPWPSVGRSQRRQRLCDCAGPRDDGGRRAGLVPPADESVVVSEAAASSPRVAVPQPTPPGFFKVVSYGEAFNASSPGDAGLAVVERDGSVEDSDLDSDLTLVDADSSGEEEEHGDDAASDDGEKDVEPKAPTESGSVECGSVKIPDAAEGDDDCFDLEVDIITRNTEHIARDGGEELEATASDADENQPKKRCGGSDDDFDEGFDGEDSTYIHIVPSPPERPAPIHGVKTGCIACDDREAKEHHRKPVRSYNDIDASDEDDDDTCGSDEEESSCEEDDEDSDVDSSEAEESVYDEDDSSAISGVEDSSGTEESEADETCSCNGDESSRDEDEDDTCSSDEGERSCEEDEDDSDADSSDDEERARV